MRVPEIFVEADFRLKLRLSQVHGEQNRRSHFAGKSCIQSCQVSLDNNKVMVGSGCGSVGRAVASDSKGPRFDSNHRQHFKLNIYCQLYRKDKNKQKEAGNGPLKKFK